MSIESKIQKIMAKAASTSSEAEAQAFMAKAEALLQEHNLTLEQVDAAERQRMDPMGRDYMAASKHSWENRLFSSVAKYYGATAIIDQVGTAKKGTPVAVGRESSRKTIEVMWPFILKQVKQAAKIVAKSDGMSTGAAERRTAEALRYRLFKETQNREEAEVSRGQAGSMALTLRDEVRDAVAEYYPRLKAARQSQTGTTGSARDAASKVSLNLQASGRSGTLRLS